MTDLSNTQRTDARIKRHVVSNLDGTQQGGLAFVITVIGGMIVAASLGCVTCAGGADVLLGVACASDVVCCGGHGNPTVVRPRYVGGCGMNCKTTAPCVDVTDGQVRGRQQTALVQGG
ncbi:hypothetical protein [uncultured Tateyamaria sp.]|uniref:hypothetical protein n=1 Tax=uncultured Tateyamaria sp. TaxID=455651 RepID=UPI0026030885|nr:hypothetical protein [uncultured Tateyamaria sp.]